MDEKIIADTISPWRQSAYFADAENLLPVFWAESSPFYKAFQTLDLTSVLELACGKGRHSERVAPLAGILTLVDVFPEHLVDCINRLKRHNNVAYVVCNGYEIGAVATASQTSVFCYDAMVHFPPEIVASYLKEINRVLRPGGRALLHHSNYSGPLAVHYGQNPQARNHMHFEMFSKLAADAQLKISQRQVLDWGGVKSLDCITTLVK